MTTTIPTIPSLPDPPSINDPTNFETEADAFLAGLPEWTDDVNLTVDAINDVAGDLSSVLQGGGFLGTSTTSMSIGSGTKTLTLQTGLTFRETWAKAYSTASPANYVWGPASYNPTTGVITITVDALGYEGSGTFTAWTVQMTGPRGDTGADAGIGKHSIPVPSGAMTPAITNGPSIGAFETTTNKVLVSSLNFDATTAESAQFSLAMPKSWNEGTVTFRAFWSHGSTTTNFGVAWGLSALAVGDGDALDAAFGTEVVVTDTGGSTDTIYATSESSAVTVAGTPAATDVVIFKVRRIPSNGSDTLAVDARLMHLAVYITTDAGNDA